MHRQRWQILLFSIISLLFTLPIGAQKKREMRGVWVATVANIDWPSKAGLSTKEQQKEAIAILDHVKELGFNTVFLQVRAACDAIYPSVFEPWSKALTGTIGKAPSPYYDPLQFWIDEAHLRGLELHAWLNPYRASMNINKLPAKHPYSMHPNRFLEYGGKRYFNPALDESRQHIVNVTKDILKRYEVDGIHTDDYFYPYPIAGENFPDSSDYAQYLSQNDTISLADWRRQNVNQTIEQLAISIKQIKPSASFGISPFGVWRNNAVDPKGSESRAGVTNYDHLYADVLTWLKEDWIDYVAPQLYWHNEHPAANFETLADWWNENCYGKPLYIGHALYKIGSNKPQWQHEDQLPNQMRYTRQITNCEGNICYSYKHLNRNLYGLQDSLSMHLYKHMALPLVTSNAVENKTEIIKLKANRRKAKWESSIASGNEKYIVYLYQLNDEFSSSNASFIYAITGSSKITFPKNKKGQKGIYYLRVATIDSYRQEGQLSIPEKVTLKR